MSFYQAMKDRETYNAYFWVKKASLKILHAKLFQLYDIQERLTYTAKLKSSQWPKLEWFTQQN